MIAAQLARVGLAVDVKSFELGTSPQLARDGSPVARERKAIYGDAARLLAKDLPIIPL